MRYTQAGESAPEKRLQRFLKAQNDQCLDIDPSYLSLYEDQGLLMRPFATIHERLDNQFAWMNRKARDGASGHFNADNSRDLLGIISEIAELRQELARVGKSFSFSPEYERVLDGSKTWLQQDGGSPMPEGFTPVMLDRYEPVISVGDSAILLGDYSKAQLQMTGEGAYARVYKFVDPNYGITFAKKKLKPGADARDVERFRREYKLMKSLDFPYILQVYQYDEKDNSYTMEFCESTLEDYVKRRNGQQYFDMGTRRRIALQFLYGLNYLHLKGHCHRDLSYRNILLHQYADEAVTVKLSDFGLAKEGGSDFTLTETEIRGTIVDPTIDRFKDFRPVNDIYAVGFVLSFIFHGIKRLAEAPSPVAEIVHRCSHSDPSQRFQTVLEVVDALEDLDFKPRGAPA